MRINHLTVDIRSLASTITCEKVREFLDKYKYSSIVIEHPSLLPEKHFRELSKIVKLCYKEKEIKD